MTTMTFYYIILSNDYMAITLINWSVFSRIGNLPVIYKHRAPHSKAWIVLPLYTEQTYSWLGFLIIRIDLHKWIILIIPERFIVIIRHVLKFPINMTFSVQFIIFSHYMLWYYKLDMNSIKNEKKRYLSWTSLCKLKVFAKKNCTLNFWMILKNKI